MKKLLASSLFMLLGVTLVPAHASSPTPTGSDTAQKLAMVVNDQTSFGIFLKDEKNQTWHIFQNLSAEQAFMALKDRPNQSNMVWLQGEGEKSYFTTDVTIMTQLQQMQAELGQLDDETVGVETLTTKLKPEHKEKIKALIQQALAKGLMAPR